MHFDLITQCMFLLVIANGAPILASRMLGDAFSQPLDCGITLPDGHPLFGTSKTFRGIIAALAATALLAPVIGVSWGTGLILAALATAGDLVSSFVKRRLGLTPSCRFTGLDQIPEALVPAMAGIRLLGLSVYDVTFVVALFFMGAIILSRIFFKLKIRQHPY